MWFKDQRRAVRRMAALVGLSSFVLFGGFAAQAQGSYPDKPVKIIVANPPGGPIDVILRVLATRLSAVWGQPVIVENRPGGAGIVSTTAVVKAAPDAYTIGMVAASSITIMPFAVDSLPFDPIKDLQPISLVARTPFIFIVRQDSPFKTWQDFVDQAKSRDLTIGSYAIGSAFHLVWEQTARRVGIKAVYAPANAAGKTQGDLIGGQLDIVLEAPSSAKGMLEGGRVRAIAITSPERFAGLPDTPTLSESGLTGYSSLPWLGLMGPAGMPTERVAIIQETVARVLKEPAMLTQLQTLGMMPVASTPQEMADTIKNERLVMQPLVKDLGIRLQ
ncbi:MAG: tripartite tricarboxylate transporter substrate binding protein [Alcaligenaceae bacterium]